MTSKSRAAKNQHCARREAGWCVKEMAIALLAVVVTLGAVVALITSMRQPREKPKLDQFRGVGEVLAEETGKLLGHNGQMVLVSRRVNDVRVKAAIRAFKKGIQPSKRMRIVATEDVAPQYANLDVALAGTGELPAEDYLRILAKHRDVTAIVSFMGVPRLTNEQIAQLGSRRPKLIAWSQLWQLRGQFQAGVLQLAVINSNTRTNQPLGTPRDWFARYYQVVTPADADALPF